MRYINPCYLLTYKNSQETSYNYSTAPKPKRGQYSRNSLIKLCASQALLFISQNVYRMQSKH